MTEFSADQQQAIQGAVEALGGDNTSLNPYRLTGNAGTGKTEVLTSITRDTSAITLTPTNKAAAVLRARGVPAVTIHSQIYAPEEVSLKEDVEATQEALDACEDDSTRASLEAELASLQARLDKAPKGKRMQFSFRSENNLRGRNVVIDEASMVGKRTLGDILLSNPKNVLLVGDPGQLPPINQEDSLRAMPPNWLLVTQHRTGDAKQLADLANKVRTDGSNAAWDLAVAMEDENSGDSPVTCLRRGDSDAGIKLTLMDEAANETCVWLCWKNETRVKINAGIRDRLGRESQFPSAGDRLVAYAKDPTDRGRWYNGSQAIVASVEAEDVPVADAFTVGSSTRGREIHAFIDSKPLEPIVVANSDFGGSWSRDERRTWQFGYCLTVHKAQGSEWDLVVVADDHSGRPDRRQWLYTALTRARKRVVWIR